MSRLTSNIPFTIGVISKMTGVAPDTLRVWEKRYGFPKPKRMGKGVRVYSAEDVEKLQLAVSLLEMGYRPGDVMTRSKAELLPLVQARSKSQPRRRSEKQAATIEQIVQGLLRYDMQSIAEALSAVREPLGLARFVREFARPLMEKVGELWAQKVLEIRHEHLVSDLLATELRRAVPIQRENNGPRVLLATLAGEQHSLGLDLWAAELSDLGLRPYVLGSDLPTEQIAKTAAAVDARVVALFVSGGANHDATQALLVELLPQLPRRVLVWLGGQGAQELSTIPDGTLRFASYAEYDRGIDDLIGAVSSSIAT